MRREGKRAAVAVLLLVVLRAGDAFAAMAPDTTPDVFAFTDTNVRWMGMPVTSAPVTITGIDAAATVTVSGGTYSVGCTGDWTSAVGTISNGQTVCVRHTAPFACETTTETTLTIGGVSDTFASTTEGCIIVLPQDAEPDPFTFAAIDGVMPGVTVTSAAVTLTGFDQAQIWPENGEMDIDCDGSLEGPRGNDGWPYVGADTPVCVRHTAALACGASTTTTLHVGNVTADFTTTTQTVAEGCVYPPSVDSDNGSGALPPWLVLAGLLLARRRQHA